MIRNKVRFSLKNADRVRSMKKYVFLLVFFIHLIVLGAQANTRTWVGSTTSSDWNLPSNWDTGSIPDGDSIVNIPHLSTGLKYPRLSSLSNAKKVIIEDKAMLDLSTFSIIRTDSFTCEIINT